MRLEISEKGVHEKQVNSPDKLPEPLPKSSPKLSSLSIVATIVILRFAIAYGGQGAFEAVFTLSRRSF